LIAWPFSTDAKWKARQSSRILDRRSETDVERDGVAGLPVAP
jgi:hypothetical protein